MAISLTSFKSQFDNKPIQLDFSSFDELEKFLYLLSERPLKGKKDAELISPAIYVDDDTAHLYPDAVKEENKKGESYYPRKNRNVTSWSGWAAVDIDDAVIEGDVSDYVNSHISGYRYVCYSTASSKRDHPKFRLVFELDRPVEAAEIRHFWYALQSHLDEAGDKQCKDLSRMYYVPATYDNAFNFIFSGGNELLRVSDLLAKYPYVEKKHGKNFMDRLPEDLQKQVIEHRKSKMDKTYIWTGYRDCPFWPKKLAAEYQTITGTGWYHKMYQIMVAIASRAIYKEYPITSLQIAQLCQEFDRENGNWYENRPLEVEADRALEYAYRKN